MTAPDIKYKPPTAPVEEHSTAGLEYLPPHLRWTLSHPGLNVVRTEMTQRTSEACESFEQENPCPSQAARNAFERFRGDRLAIDRLFREATKLYVEAQRRLREEQKKEGGGGELSLEHRENEQFVNSLRKKIGML